MKVYELAKELGIDNKTLMDFLAKNGSVLKSHMNLVPEGLVKKAREKFGRKSSPSQSQLTARGRCPSAYSSGVRTSTMRAFAALDASLKASGPRFSYGVQPGSSVASARRLK